MIVGDVDTGTVVGVLPLAHDQPTDGNARAVLEAVADLAAVAVDRDRAAARSA